VTAPAKARTNTPAHPVPGTGVSMAARTRGSTSRSEFADDPFVRRLAADPAQNERDASSRHDIIVGLKQLQAQRAKLTLADEMYDGDVGMVYASMQVKKLLSKQGVDDNEIEDFNYARVPVDAVAEKLQIAGVKVAPLVDDEDDDEDDEEEGGGESADPKTIRRAERAIKTIRRNNRLDVYEKMLHQILCRHGEAYLFLWPVTTGDAPGGKVVSVDFRVNDGHTVTCVYDLEDPLRIAYVLKSWETPSDFPDDPDASGQEGTRPVLRANLYYPGPPQIDADGVTSQGPGRVERWVTKPGGSPQVPSSWVRLHQLPAEDADVTDDDLEQVAADEFGDPDNPLSKDDIPAPYGLTWFHFRNGLPMGKPEHEAAYGPQKLINKLVWMFAGIIEYLGFPQRYLMVDPKIDDPLFNSVDPDHPDDDDDDPENEGGTSGLRSDPGSVWKMYGKTTGQYSAADPDTFMKPLDRFIKSMAELTDVPAYKFTKSSGDMPSGEAFREANDSYYTKIKDRQDRADPEWQDAYELALRMMNIEGVTVDVRWQPVAPVDDLNGVQVLKAKGDLGVPSEVLLNEAGYPDEMIKQWMEKNDGLSMSQRIALFVQLSTAVQALSAGVTAGVVPDNMAQALIARFLGDIAEGTDDAEDTGLPAPTFRDPPPTLPPGGLLGVPGGPGVPGAAGGRPGAKQAPPAKRTAAKAAPGRRPAGGQPQAKAKVPVKKAAPAKAPQQPKGAS
jgi:hypothetical protein